METPQTILIYTDGEVIGDGMIRLAFAAAIKRAVPGIRITWLASGYSVYADVLKEMAAPYIDELVIIERRIPLLEYITGPKTVRGRSFDVVIDTQRNLKRAWWLSRISHRRFISAASNYFLTTAKEKLPITPRFIDHLINLGSWAVGQPLMLEPLSLPDGRWEAAALTYLSRGSTYIGFVVGAGHADKCWKLEHFITLAKEQVESGRVPVIILGPRENELAEALRKQIPEAFIPLLDQDKIRVDANSPYFTIALGGVLSACIANDSGGSHLVAAGGAPMVVLVRSCSVRAKFTPTAPRVIALTPADFGLATMQEIPVEAVSQALSQILH